MGKSTISMAIFNSYVSLPEGNLRFTNTTLWMFKWHDVGYFHKTAHSFWLSSSRKPRLLKYLDISNWTINIPDIDSNMVYPTAPFFLWFSIVKIMGSSWFRWIKLGEAYGQVCDIKKVLQLWVPGQQRYTGACSLRHRRREYSWNMSSVYHSTVPKKTVPRIPEIECNHGAPVITS